MMKLRALRTQRSQCGSKTTPTTTTTRRTNTSIRNSNNNSSSIASPHDQNDELKGYILAVLHCLEHEGVSRASTNELREGVRSCKYGWALDRSMEYANILIKRESVISVTPSKAITATATSVNDKTPKTTALDTTTRMNDRYRALCFLLLNAYSALCSYQAGVYKQAYQRYHGLRNSHRMTSSYIELDSSLGQPITRTPRSPPPSSEVVGEALGRKIQLAEECCSAQKGLVLMQALMKRMENCSSNHGGDTGSSSSSGTDSLSDDSYSISSAGSNSVY